MELHNADHLIARNREHRSEFAPLIGEGRPAIRLASTLAMRVCRTPDTIGVRVP